jgi:mannosyltransferase OCH1-like enzyme
LYIYPFLFYSAYPRSDIWRLAVLYLRGGVYIDTDAYLNSNLDDVVLANDSLVLSFEDVAYSNMYNSWYHLSDLADVSVSSHPCVNHSDTFTAASTTGAAPYCHRLEYFPSVGQSFEKPTRRSSEVILVQWMMIAKPGHPFLLRALENIVELIRLEFHCNSAVNGSLIPEDFPMQRLFLVTGPWVFTATIRELIRKDPANLNQLRIANNYYFRDAGAKHEQKRTYFRHMRVSRRPLLKSYAINCTE